MKSGFRSLALLLGILGIGDLVMVPVMLGAGHTSAGAPPTAAIVLGGILGAATLASIPALLQGRRSAFWLVVACRVIDIVQDLLGIFNGPGTLFVVVGVISGALSIAAIAMLFRLNPRATYDRAPAS